MSERTSLGRRALLAGMGAGVASLAGCLDRSDDTEEGTPLEVTSVEESTGLSGDPEIIVQYTAPETVDNVALTTRLYRDDQLVRRVTDYGVGVAGDVGHTVEYLNAEFDDYEATVERFDGVPDEPGEIDVDSTETVSTDDGSEVLVEFVAPGGTDRLDVSITLFDSDAETEQGAIRTIAEPVHLDGESGGAMSHAVTITPFGWADDYSVSVRRADSE
jgi:hypothetical protein